ncbi:MAG: cation:proton antiporter [Lachnospiraceae bacterium]
MLTSFALIFLCGMFLGEIFRRAGLPRLLGMLITGIVTGPHLLNLLDHNLLLISADLRQAALIIILTRAGLSLDLNDLKKAGRSAILMCFVPACFEMAGILLLAPKLLNISVAEAAVMGAVLAAVSPAVVVPKMLHLMENGYGTDKSIPQMIIAGASVDDIFVIVMFTAAVGLAQGQAISPVSLLHIPVSIIAGIIAGIGTGIILNIIFTKTVIHSSYQVIILLSVSFLLTTIENKVSVPFSGLLAIMSAGVTIQKQNPAAATGISAKYAKLWIAAEIFLFALVGATVDLSYAMKAGIPVILVIGGALLFRMAGVWFCMIKTKLSTKERLFCMFAYTPKATVQAAIGSVPLSLGLSCGHIVLTAAVLAILITAPLGALAIDSVYKKFLYHGGGRP